MKHSVNYLGFNLDKVIGYPIAALVKTVEEKKCEVDSNHVHMAQTCRKKYKMYICNIVLSSPL